MVGYSEGDHAIYPDELIESCQIVHGVLHNTLHGMPDLVLNPAVQARKRELTEEASILINALRKYGADRSDDPWSDPAVIAGAIRTGLLDTPHFTESKHLCGKIVTSLIDGGWYAIDPETGYKMPEAERIMKNKRLWQE